MTLFLVHTLYIQAVPTIRQPPGQTGQNFEQTANGTTVPFYLVIWSLYTSVLMLAVVAVKLSIHMFAYQERLLHLINFHFVSV